MASAWLVLVFAFASLSTCRPEQHRMLGGWSDVETKSREILDVADKALYHIEKQGNALFKQKVVDVLSAKRKVVAGLLYDITIKTQFTNCRRDKELDFEKCPTDDNQSAQICTVTIWEKKWDNFFDVKFNCTSEEDLKSESKPKRAYQIIGGDDHDYVQSEFKNFIKTYNKVYDSEEEMVRRFKIFQENMKRVGELRKTEQGTAKYGATQFADLTREEFQKYYLGLKSSLAKYEATKIAKIPNVEIPIAFDWRNHSAVTGVKNQEQCGSCWAFSVTGNVEGQWAIKNSKLISLSEQELVDCDTADEGCNGGYMTNAYEAIIKLGGLEGESDYPYDAETEKCHFQKEDVRVTIKSYVNISKDENEMAQWLYKNGPISIGINANAMQFYFGGISHPFKFLCNPDDLDHGVLIVGYGQSTYPLFNKTIPYWIVKNSWGASWGEKGYYRVFRGDGTCGLNLMATSSEV